MLAIFWVQSWWLGNTPENQDEPSRKNGHIFDTFFWTDRFFRLLTFTSLWKRWNRQISHKKSPKSPVEGFLPRLFKSKIIWDSNHVLRNGQIIESLTLNFIFQWWKGTFKDCQNRQLADFCHVYFRQKSFDNQIMCWEMVKSLKSNPWISFSSDEKKHSKIAKIASWRIFAAFK